MFTFFLNLFALLFDYTLCITGFTDIIPTTETIAATLILKTSFLIKLSFFWVMFQNINIFNVYFKTSVLIILNITKKHNSFYTLQPRKGTINKRMIHKEVIRFTEYLIVHELFVLNFYEIRFAVWNVFENSDKPKPRKPAKHYFHKKSPFRFICTSV